MGFSCKRQTEWLEKTCDDWYSTTDIQSNQAGFKPSKVTLVKWKVVPLDHINISFTGEMSLKFSILISHLISDIINNDDSMRWSVIGRHNSSKPFLSCSIPLQQQFIIHLEDIHWSIFFHYWMCSHLSLICPLFWLKLIINVQI